MIPPPPILYELVPLSLSALFSALALFIKLFDLVDELAPEFLDPA